MPRGRALYYPAILIVGWAAARMAITTGTSETMPPDANAIEKPALVALPEPSLRTDTVPFAYPSLRRGRDSPVPRFFSRRVERYEQFVAPQLREMMDAKLPGTAGSREFSGTNRPIPVAFAEVNAPAGRSRFSGYLYSFWRLDSVGTAVTAPAAQYGGSQSGAIFILDPFGTPDRGLAIQSRIALTPQDGRKELSLGVRWQKPASLPVTLAIERRLRSQTHDDWIGYAAGGIDSRKLPAGFSLDAYGQIGLSSGQDGGAFFDAQARMTRKLAALGNNGIRGGLGAWGGGQQDINRLDIGPTIGTQLTVGSTKLRLDLDWRHRVAGNARPTSGAALTISTGF